MKAMNKPSLGVVMDEREFFNLRVSSRSFIGVIIHHTRIVLKMGMRNRASVFILQFHAGKIKYKFDENRSHIFK
jgi:hypothetical protein